MGKSSPGVQSSAGDHLAAKRFDRVYAGENGVSDLLRRGARHRGPGQRRGARNMGCGHAGPVGETIRLSGHGAVDIDSGGCEVHRDLAVAAEERQAVIAVRCGDGDHVVNIIAGRVLWRHVVVAAVVSGGRDEKHARITTGSDGIVHGLFVALAAPTVAGKTDVDAEVRPHHGGVIDRAYSVRRVPASAAVEELDCHDG